MTKSRARRRHYVALGLEPSPRRQTVQNAAVSVLSTTFLVIRLGDTSPTPTDITARWAIGLFVACSLLATLGAARLWYTINQVVRLSAEPDLAPAEAERATDAEPLIAPSQPPPVVLFETPPTLFRRVGRRRRVTATANVLGGQPLQIVYLRLFANRARQDCFERGAWREFGYVHLLSDAEFVAPSELARLRRKGRLDELFVTSERQLLDHLDAAPTGPEQWDWWSWYGQYPVRAALCHDAFWKKAVAVLLHQADLVVLDLSGFDLSARGTLYELQQVVNTVPAHRTVLLADPKSDIDFLTTQIKSAWSTMAEGSPNIGIAPRTLHGYVIDYFRDVHDKDGHVVGRQLHASRSETRWLMRQVQDRLVAAADRLDSVCDQRRV
ncbi:hypothetical protein [Lentzea sp. NPDC059081]|uniref:hypothetical protein n=1 Tax=Lentzea sp. NPDC059081 TaxID=3346719 RepID=UPI00368511C5